MAKNKPKNKILIVVESPNKIRKIASYLSKDYIVLASYGHVMDLSVGDPKYKLGIDIENNYKPRYRIYPDKKDKIQAIIDAATTADTILLATDNDREGEAIAFNLKDCVESCGKPIYRIVFNEITKSVIQKAVANPGQLDENMFSAQQARRIVDRIVGFMGSEFLRQWFGPNISAGRVQSVATRLIVDREKEIESFVPEEYWNISSTLSKSQSNPFIAKYIGKVNNEEEADKIKQDLDKDSFLIDKIDAQEKKRNPYPPLITSSLQQAASTRFGMSVSATMKAAQSLYETGLITYLRTDSTRISPEAIDSVRDFLDKNNYNKPNNPNFFASKESAQDAHEAIRPTDVFKLPQNIFVDDQQQKVYRLIWERFVASQMNPAVYDTVSVSIKSSSGHQLKANGRILKYEGWLAVSSDQKKDSEDDVKLPILNENDNLFLVDPGNKAEQKFTQPPSRYSEASIVRELEKRGIGRPSTYADTIEKIKGRNYVETHGKAYHATDLGKKVIDALTRNFKFMDYNYTADMEVKLDEIAEGKLTYVKMLDDFFIPFQEECKKADITEAEDFGFKCEKCQNKMILKHGRFGFYMKCIDKDCKETITVDIVDGKPVLKEKFHLDPAPEDIKCPLCNSPMVINPGKFGPYYSCSEYRNTRCKGSRKIPYGKKCPDCGNELFMALFGSNKRLACMGYPNCKHIEDMPIDTPNNWVNPKNIQPKKKFAVKRILKAQPGRKVKKENKNEKKASS
jgi:DNA topoisomerase-1